MLRIHDVYAIAPLPASKFADLCSPYRKAKGKQVVLFLQVTSKLSYTAVEEE